MATGQLDDAARKYYKLSGGAQPITPEILKTEIKKIEINKELVKLHNAWREKVLTIRNEDAAIVDYEKTKINLTAKGYFLNPKKDADINELIALLKTKSKNNSLNMYKK